MIESDEHIFLKELEEKVRKNANEALSKRREIFLFILGISIGVAGNILAEGLLSFNEIYAFWYGVTISYSNWMMIKTGILLFSLLFCIAVVFALWKEIKRHWFVFISQDNILRMLYGADPRDKNGKIIKINKKS